MNLVLSLASVLPPPVLARSTPDQNVVGLDDLDHLPVWKGRPRVALVLHGVACTWHYLEGLARCLEGLPGGAAGRLRYGAVVRVTYDWRRSIDDNAARLVDLLGRLGDRSKSVDLFGYSMGGLVARRAVETGNPILLPPVRHVFTFNSPHRGSPLAEMIGWRTLRWATWLVRSLSPWLCDGIRDLAPRSPFLSTLARLERRTRYVFVAGNDGSALLGGVTQPAFGKIANDGVAAVTSQLDLDPMETGPIPGPRPITVGSDPSWVRLVLSWNHFSILGQLRPDVFADGVSVIQAALATPRRA